MKSYVYRNCPKFILMNFGLLVVTMILGFFWLSQNNIIPYYGFAVDTINRVYIGARQGYIKVYKDNSEVGQFRFTSRGYAFTIKNGTELLYATGNKIYHIDLESDFLHDKSAINCEIDNQLKKQLVYRNTSFTGNGKIYIAKVTPCSCEVFDENGSMLLSIGNKKMIVVFILFVITGIAFLSLSILTAIAITRRRMVTG